MKAGTLGKFNGKVVPSLTFLVGIIAAYLVTDEYRYGHWVRVVVLSAIFLLCCLLLFSQIHSAVRRMRLKRFRGIRGAGLETLPVAEIESIWNSAEEEVIAFGMGMSRLSKNADLIRQTVERGVRVRLILIDPDWLASESSVAERLGNFYDTENIIGKNEDAYRRLCRLRDELLRDHGRDAIQVHVHQNVIMMSATIADPRSRRASGFVEFHLFKAGDKRFRLNVVNYPREDGERSLITQVVHAIELAVADVANS
jgi:hypothetical protein